VEKAAIRGFSFLLKKVIGWCCCDKTAPMVILGASVVTSKGRENQEE